MTLGRHSYFLGTDKGDNTIIGNFSSIAGGTYIHGADNHAWVKNNRLVSTCDQYFRGEYISGYKKGDVRIGNDVWIGEDTQILNGVTIGDGAIIGAHAVIAKDVPPYAVVVGNPGRVVKYRFSEDIIEQLLKIKWWDWEERKVSEAREYFDDIDKFVERFKV